MAENKVRHFGLGRLAILTASVLLGAAYVGMRLIISPARVSALAHRTLSEYLGGKITIGSASFGVLTGITLENVVLSDPPVEVPVLEVQRIRVRPRLWDSLRGMATFSSVEIDRPRLWVHRREDGTWNVALLVKKDVMKIRPIPRVHVRWGRLQFHDTFAKRRLPGMDIPNIRVFIEPEHRAHDVIRWSVSLEQKQFGRWDGSGVFHLESRAGESRIHVQDLIISPEFGEWLSPRWRKEWEAIAPTSGILDAKAFLRHDPAGSPAWFHEGQVTIQNLGLESRRLPWPLTGARVNANVKQWRCSFTMVNGQFGPISLEGGGELRHENKKILADVALRSPSFALHSSVIKPLGKNIERIWNYLQPQGSVSWTAHLKGEIWPNLQPEMDAEIALEECKLTPKPISFPIERVQGEVRYSHGQIGLRGVQGRLLGGEVRLHDDVFELGAAAPMNLRLSFARLQLMKDAKQDLLAGLMGQLPPEFQQFWPDLRFRTMIQGVCDIQRKPAGPPLLHCSGTLDVEDGTIEHPKLPRPVTRLGGKINFERDLGGTVRLQMVELSGRSGQIHLAIPRAALALAPEASQEIEISLKNIPLNKELRSFLPPKLQQIWDDFQPSGMLDISTVLSRPAGAQRALLCTATAMLREGKLCYSKLPYPLYDVSGRIDIEGERVRFAEIDGRNGDTKIHIAAMLRPFGASPGVELKLRAEQLALDSRLRSIIPERFRASWDIFRPTGSLNMDLTSRIALPPDPTHARAFNFSGKLELDKAELTSAVTVREARGTATIEEAEFDISGAHRMEGRLELKQVRIDNKMLTDLHARFRSEKGVLHVENLAASSYDGRITGEVHMPETLRPDLPSEVALSAYAGRLSLKGLNLEKLMRDSQLKTGGVSGTLDAEASFSGVRERPGTFTSKGELHITDCRIHELPGLLRLLEFFRFANVESPTFKRIELLYEFREKMLHARALNLIGEAFSLYGEGQVGLDRTINFRFRPEISEKGKTIPTISIMTTLLRDKVIPIELSGEFDDPIWKMNPLLSLTRLLRDVSRAILSEEALRFLRGQR